MASEGESTTLSTKSLVIENKVSLQITCSGLASYRYTVFA